MKKKIIAIDPGDVESAYVIWDGENILEFDKIENEKLLSRLSEFEIKDDPFLVTIVIEKIASYGMPVGKHIFETVFWTGRFYDKFINWTNVERHPRKDVKMHICGATKATDTTIVTALVDRFADRHEHGKHGKGTRKNQGFFYGFSKDIWQAFALAVYYYDTFVKNGN